MLNRRSFLNALGLSSAALALDPERLLWTPTKTIFIPAQKTAWKSIVWRRPPPWPVTVIQAAPGLSVGDEVTFANIRGRYTVAEIAESVLRAEAVIDIQFLA